MRLQLNKAATRPAIIAALTSMVACSIPSVNKAVMFAGAELARSVGGATWFWIAVIWTYQVVSVSFIIDKSLTEIKNLVD